MNLKENNSRISELSEKRYLV